MKKILLATMAAALMLMGCGGSKSGGSSSSSAAGSECSATGLKDGQWPAVVYDQYGIPEPKTAGKIVFTQFGDEGSYQYEVCYKNVTREELLAWTNGLKAKGFRMEERDQERLDKSAYDYDVMIYQPEEGKDKCLRVAFDFKDGMSFEYYADDPNPAFEVVTTTDDYGDEHMEIQYDVKVGLCPIDNAKKVEGKADALALAAEDFASIPNARVVQFSGNDQRFTLGIGFYGDHLLTAADIDVLHESVAKVLEGKGAKFSHALTGKVYTAEQLQADKVRSYNVELDGRKFLMMVFSDYAPGDFGGGFNFQFTKNNN